MTTDPPDGSLTLLYVEDNLASASVMEAVLELRPVWRFVHAGSVEAGLAAALSEQPDLVLLDMHLPDGSGAQALATLKADDRTRWVPVVVLTAESSGRSSTALRQTGAEQVWTKPHDLSLMLEFFDEVAARERGPAGATGG